MAALYKYEQLTGRAAVSDFAGLQDLTNVKLSLVVDLVYSGLACGYQAARKPLDFDQLDVADWIGEDQAVIEQVMHYFAESFPAPSGEKNGIAPLNPAKAEA